MSLEDMNRLFREHAEAVRTVYCTTCGKPADIRLHKAVAAAYRRGAEATRDLVAGALQLYLDRTPNNVAAGRGVVALMKAMPLPEYDGK